MHMNLELDLEVQATNKMFIESHGQEYQGTLLELYLEFSISNIRIAEYIQTLLMDFQPGFSRELKIQGY